MRELGSWHSPGIELKHFQTRNCEYVQFSESSWPFWTGAYGMYGIEVRGADLGKAVRLRLCH